MCQKCIFSQKYDTNMGVAGTTLSFLILNNAKAMFKAKYVVYLYTKVVIKAGAPVPERRRWRFLLWGGG